MGHEQTSRHVGVMSVTPLKADIHQRGLHVRLVPKAGDKGAPARSRPQKKAGKLSAGRVARLDALGFEWSRRSSEAK